MSITQDKKHTLAEIFENGLAAYCNSGKRLSSKQWKVVNRILTCHTPILGGHMYQCDNCSSQELHYNSCRDRHCPRCQSLARASWVQKRADELLPTGYFHLVFTIPSEFNEYALYNKESFYTLFFNAVSSTLLTLGKDPKHLGASIGVISVLHTWGRTLVHHPHIHCIIPGGGCRQDGKKWLSFRSNYIFPIKVMSLLFRRIFIESFLELAKKQDFVIPPTKSNQTIDNLIQIVKKKNWVVYAKEPFATPINVIRYLGNYTHRIAIAQSRIIAVDQNHVSFKYKDHGDNGVEKVMKLEIAEFIRRFLLHVLPDGFVRIRYSGFLSNRNRSKNISTCMRLLGKKYQKSHELTTVKQQILAVFGKDISACKKCKVGHYISYKLLKGQKRTFRKKKDEYFTHRRSCREKYREATSSNDASMQLRN